MSDPATIDATLDLLTLDELAEVHSFVQVWERAGCMLPAEAAVWLERIAIWKRFRLGRRVESPKPVAPSPLLEDPDLFLP